MENDQPDRRSSGVTIRDNTSSGLEPDQAEKVESALALLDVRTALKAHRIRTMEPDDPFR